MLDVRPRQQLAPVNNVQYIPVAATAVGAAGAGVMASGVKRAYKYMKGEQGGKQPVRKSTVSKKVGTIAPQGDNQGTKQIRVRKAKKSSKKRKSVKSEIKSIKKRLGKMPVATTKEFKELTPMLLQISSNFNQSRAYDIEVMGRRIFEDQIAGVDGVNLTLKNTATKITNLFFQMRLQNHSTSVAEIKYQFVKCMDDDNESPLFNIKEYNDARGLTIAAEVGITPASATTAEIPRSQLYDYDSGTAMAKVFGVHPGKFKPLAPVANVRVGPGDYLKIEKKLGTVTYKPEIFDQEPYAFLSGDVRLLMHVSGQLCKNLANDATAPGLVGLTAHRLIGSRYQSGTIKVQNGLGLKLYNFISTFDKTNLATPQIVTNEDPSIEVPAS